MTRIMTALIWAGVGAFVLALVACSTISGEYCTNTDYNQQPFFKAMARSSDSQCYWVWNRSDQGTADAGAMSNCHNDGFGCTLIRRGNQYVGGYNRPSGSAGGASPADFFQGIAAGALMAGGNPAAGAMLMGDLANRSSSPAHTTGVSQGDQSCFNLRQNEIVARLKPRVDAAVGI